MQPAKIVLCGSIAIDRLMDFSGSYKDLIKPDKLHVLSISILLNQLNDTHGGVAANIAYSLALLGEKPILLGSVGPDGLGYIAKLKKLGVDTKHVHISEIPTASFNVITDSDNNQVGGFYPGAMGDSQSLSFLPWKTKAAICVLSPHDPVAMARQVQECKANHLRLVYDIGQQVSNVSASDIQAGLAAAEVLIANEYELAVISEKTELSVEEIYASVPVVITTQGKDGSRINGQRTTTEIRVPAVPPRTVVDPTGAGDAYRAGFLYAYARGWDLKTCGRMGATTAVYAVEHTGTQTHAFDRHELVARYQQHFPSSSLVKNIVE